VDGFLFLDREKFAASFAADVRPALSAFIGDSQVPWGLEALQGAVSEPAWRSKPSYYLVATDDGMIPPPAQRMMASRAGSHVTEASGSHAIYVSNPEAVAAVIIGAKAPHELVGPQRIDWRRYIQARQCELGELQQKRIARNAGLRADPRDPWGLQVLRKLIQKAAIEQHL
jgi:hypothetical protein